MDDTTHCLKEKHFSTLNINIYVRWTYEVICHRIFENEKIEW